LVLVDGEKLIGRLESSDDTSLTFKSNFVGEVKVEWTNGKMLDSNNSFAIIEKAMKLRWNEDQSKIPQGKLSADATEISVIPNPGAPV
jgi:hypothetical protein